MKKFKKRRLAAMLAAMMLATTMTGGMTALAATVTVESNDPENILKDHTYDIYRVFQGKNSEDGTMLVDIEWGEKFTDFGKESALIAMVKPGAASVTAEEVAKYLSDPLNVTAGKEKEFAEYARQYVEKEEKAGKVLKTETVKTGDEVNLEPGYYLILDKTVVTGQEDAVKNPAILQVTGSGNFVIKNKTSKPDVTKEIWEESLLEDGGNNIDFVNDEYHVVSDQWNKVGDYDIGDDVPFKLEAIIPANTVSNPDEVDAAYATYTIRFEDKLDRNLGLNEDWRKYKVFYQIEGETELRSYTFDKEKDLKFSKQDPADEKNNMFTLEIKDIIKLPGFEADKSLNVYVLFTAELKSGAVAGVGEENDVKLYYTNDYTTGGEGFTVGDTVVALTFDAVIDKYTKDANDNKTRLEGAKFKLYRVTTTVPTNLQTEKMVREIGAGDGTETIEETYYDFTAEYIAENKLELVTFSTDTETAAPSVISVDKDGTFTEFKTNNTGNMQIHGLDRDTYILVELMAPDGYNVLKEGTVINIKNTGLDNPYKRETYEKSDYKGDGVEYTITYANKEADADYNVVGVLNKSGSTLPETGGTGTMILYMTGTALMACAVFFMTMKGRRKEEDAQ